MKAYNKNSQNRSNQSAQLPAIHVVQFYDSGYGLVRNLRRGVITALKAGETCVVVATKRRLEKLEEQIAQALDLKSLKQTGQYVSIEAAELLDELMVHGTPDRNRFQQTIGRLARRLAKAGKPVQIYGELVALLWQRGNKKAVMQLENMWDELAHNLSLSLHCVYPDLQFIMDPETRETIRRQHTSYNRRISHHPKHV